MKLQAKLEMNGAWFSPADIARGITLPQAMTEALAEFLGIMAGDGCITKYKNDSYYEHYTSVTGNSISDVKYFEDTVLVLFHRLFGLNLRIAKLSGQHTIRVYIRSKAIFNFLISLGMHAGPKENIGIPRALLEKREYLPSFLRGIADTDGCISLKSYNHEYPVISIRQKSRLIITQLEAVLKDMGFTVSMEYDVKTDDKRGFTFSSNRICLYGRKNLAKWAKLIGFHNPRHLRKIKKYGTGAI